MKYVKISEEDWEMLMYDMSLRRKEIKSMQDEIKRLWQLVNEHDLHMPKGTENMSEEQREIFDSIEGDLTPQRPDAPTRAQMLYAIK